MRISSIPAIQTKIFYGDANWKDKLTSCSVTLVKALTLGQAIDEVKAGGNVFTITKSEARIVAQAASTRPIRKPEIDYGKENERGYYYHFHTSNRKGAHVWYLISNK